MSTTVAQVVLANSRRKNAWGISGSKEQDLRILGQRPHTSIDAAYCAVLYNEQDVLGEYGSCTGLLPTVCVSWAKVVKSLRLSLILFYHTGFLILTDIKSTCTVRPKRPSIKNCYEKTP